MSLRSLICLTATVAAQRTVVMGITGSGKSSLINSLLGINLARVSDFSTGTFDVTCYESERFGEICDSMGFFDGLAETQFTNFEILKRIQERVPNISGLLLVVDPTNESRQGYMAQQVNMILAAQLAFGESMWTQRTAIVISKTETFPDTMTVLEYVDRLMTSVLNVKDMKPPAAIVPVQCTMQQPTRAQLEKRDSSFVNLSDFITRTGSLGEVPVEIQLSADLAYILDSSDEVLRALRERHEQAKTRNDDLRSQLDSAKEALELSVQKLDEQIKAEETHTAEMHKQKAELMAEEANLLRRADTSRRTLEDALAKQRDLMESGRAELRHNKELQDMYREQVRQAQEQNKSGVGAMIGGVVGFFVTGGNPEGFALGSIFGASV